ncbi:type I-G CRISPR-associated protein Csb2 [Pengzhenrongella sp.]|uniref:type I-G CRISPR-associated protein Csb2 n=1 Tax=Pengzhenrongella sp. TaxID=2888820 RepID=UPI002F935A44
MSADLTVSVRFPNGRFSGSTGNAGEWPPSPARLAAALLSVAGESGRPVMVELFAAPPPIIDAPTAEPTTGTGRWVPTQYTVDVNGRTPKLVRGGQELVSDTFDRKEAALAQPSVHVGDASVSYVWPGLGDLAAALVPVARQVPYLGRPTTPAVISVAATEPVSGPVAPGRVRLVPDMGGALRLGVPSSEHLASLDAVHESRLRNRSIGFDQPVKTQRTFATYRTVEPPQPIGVGCATRREALTWVGQQILYRVADRGVALAGDILLAVGTVTAELGAREVIPVLWGVGGDADGRLKAVLVCDPSVGELPATIQVPTRTGLVRLESSPPDDVPGQSLEVWLASRLLARSPLWTTLTPVNLGVDEALTLHQAQPGLEALAGEPVVGFGTHREPRGSWQPYFPERTSSGYVSVQFAESVHGPLFLKVAGARVALIPADPGTHDDDPRRGTLL